MLLLLHKTLKGSRNTQGFALIRAVLLLFLFKTLHCFQQIWFFEASYYQHDPNSMRSYNFLFKFLRLIQLIDCFT